MMSLVHLSSFLDVSHCGSVTVAAKNLDYSQPRVSEHLRALEASCGVPLFHREKNRLTLTDAGKHLQRRGTEIFQLLEQIHAELVATREQGSPPRPPTLAA